MYAAPSSYEHRNPDWIGELRKVAGIPADAPISLRRDYGVLGTKTVIDKRPMQWTGGYIADWQTPGGWSDIPEIESEQEVLVQNVPVKVRKWVSK